MAVTNLKSRLGSACGSLLSKQGVAVKALSACMLPIAACSAMAEQTAGDEDKWKLDAAFLVYSETDRVQAFEPVIQAKRNFGKERVLSLKLAVDVLTGASPSGAVTSTIAQTYTRPSGNGSYTTPAGEHALDDTFHDTRVAVSAGWSQPWSESVTWAAGGNISKEYDYLSLSTNGSVDWDFNQNNSKLSFALSLASDTWEPEGGIPIAGSCMFGASADTGCTETSFAETRGASTESKTLTDWVIGFSQVLGRNTVSEFAISGSDSSGYLNDPFKVVSVVDSSGDPLRHIHENRPDSRSKLALFARVKTWLRGKDVLDVSYRRQSDDWGLASNTLDMKYRFGLGKSWIQPRVRYYQQSAVDFYTPFLLDSNPIPTDYTADNRQGNFDAITLGLEYGRALESGREWQVALELYQQTHDEPDNKIGSLSGLDLVPDLDAVMLRFNFSL